ncbi:MAG TPA: xanthine dehydrogenase family protein subunit M [Anaerolineales bacterium]|jgi:carbon-monoxide dehydrogenase medium subunit
MASTKQEVLYFAPASLEAALELLDQHAGKLNVLAGGTDLVRDMNLKFKVPPGFMWIGKIGLEYVERQNGHLRVGAATRMQTAGSSEVLRQQGAAVARAAGKLASPPVRSLATLGGNLVNASPGADTACALLGLGAEVVLTSKGGSRTVLLEAFFTGPGETVIKPNELMTEIVFKPTGKGQGSAYAKVGRRQAMTLAVLNAAARVELDGDGKCSDVRIAVGAAAPTPLRAVEAETLLRGQPWTEEAIEAAAAKAAEEIKPIDDVHGTAWYRRKLARVLVGRTLREAGEIAQGAR